jgi:diguanylate cyclase (GGDEF)-like protein
MDQYKHTKLTFDADQKFAFQDKVQVLADEVLTIVKELHEEQRSLVNSKLIAKKMCSREAVKQILDDYGQDGHGREASNDLSSQSVDDVLDRFIELLPSSIRESLLNIKAQHIPSDSEDTLDIIVNIIKKLFDSISSRVNELESILQKTTHFLFEMDQNLKKEVSSVDGKYQESITLKHSIMDDARMIKQSFDVYSDISIIKKIVFGKIANIAKTIEEKREQEMCRLKETKKTLEEISHKMSDIVCEAEAIRRRSFESEFESLQDNLTKLYNRKAYEYKVEETFANLRRYSISSSLLICDMDHFKKINDNYGHGIGDLALMKIAQIFKDRLRINDFISRYGGDEFAFILPHTSLPEAKEISEHIRSFIENTRFTFKSNKIIITVSIGISTFKKSDNASTVFERADAALYLAKKSGRNMVKIEDDVEQ